MNELNQSVWKSDRLSRKLAQRRERLQIAKDFILDALLYVAIIVIFLLVYILIK